MLRHALTASRASRTTSQRYLCRNTRSYASDANPQSRIQRLESRLPRFLAHYITPLRTAPISHITAFLLLHEITALLPLFGLTAYFHYYNWLPPYISEWKWISTYTEKSGNFLRKRGWIKDEKRSGRWFGRGEQGTRLVIEAATAYAIVKALLPLRIAFSIAATPTFARWTVVPFVALIGRMFSRKQAAPAVGSLGVTGSKGASMSPAAGTNAVGGAAVPKQLKG